MRIKPLVFISSTSDLLSERDGLRAELGPWYEPYLFEDDGSRRESPESRIRHLIARCDVFLGLLGARYGSHFPDGSGKEARSISEWEFELAREREHLPLMIFVKDIVDEGAIDPAQRRFRDRVTGFREGVWANSYRSKTDLVPKVLNSLQNWLLEFWEASKRSSEQVVGRTHRLLRVVCMALVLLTAVALILHVTGSLTGSALLLLAAAAAVGILGSLAILLSETR